MNSTPSAARLLLAIPDVGEGGIGAEEPPQAVTFAEYLPRRGAKWPELLKRRCGNPYCGQNGCKRDAAECGLYRLATLPSPRKADARDEKIADHDKDTKEDCFDWSG